MIKNIEIKKGSAFIIIGTVLLVMVGAVTVFWFTTKSSPTKHRIIHMKGSQMTDFGRDKILVGFSQHVFVGKVIKQIGVNEQLAYPITQFEVEIIDNIKGDLGGKVVVEQEGGYDSKGMLYIMDSDLVSTGDDDSFLMQPGVTYLMAANSNENVTRIIVNSSNGLHLISDNKTLSMTELRTLVENDKMVLRFKEAYVNEILFSGHVKNGKTKNSFQSLLLEEQERLRAEVEYKKSLLQTN